MKEGWLCTGESACMLTGRRDMSTDIVFNDGEKQQQQQQQQQQIKE